MKRSKLYWVFGLVFVLAAALFLRVFHFEYYPFGFDAVQVIKNADHIADGKITLIGPRTGPANFFTGPLYYYIVALATVFVKSPYSGVLANAMVATITCISLYAITAKLYSNKHAFIFSLLWATSPFIIFVDRLIWNPVLSYGSAAIGFLAVLGLSKDKKYSAKFDSFLLLLLFLCSFLGFQAHFSGLFYPILLIGSLWSIRKLTFKRFMVIVLGLVVSLIPSLIFDLRNNWLHVQGVRQLLSESSGGGGWDGLFRVITVLRVMIESSGKVLAHDTKIQLVYLFGIVSTILFVVKRNEFFKTKEWRIVTIWSLIFLVGMSMYTKNIPDYYYLPLYPVLIWIWTAILIQVISNKKMLAAAAVLWVLYISSLLFFDKKTLNFEVGNQLSIVSTVRYLSSTTPISKIQYDISPYEQEGIQYLVSLHPPALREDGSILHITYPYKGGLFTKKFDNASVWIDPRNNVDKNYASFSDFIIETKKPIELVERFSVVRKEDVGRTFSIVNNGKLLTDTLTIYSLISDKESSEFKRLLDYLNNRDRRTWVRDATNPQIWLQNTDSQIFRLETSTALEKEIKIY